MADHHETEEPDVQPEISAADRSTAPQGPYTTRDVATGLAVAAVGVALTFGVALALTL